MRKGRFRRHWAEVEEYRGLLEPPGEFRGGLTLRTLLGVLFIALVLTPGELYLGLFSGGGIGGAGPWLAAVLFVELARRSFISLRRQEIFLLVYVASALVSREDGAFVELLWRQYFAHSAEAIGAGVAELLPWWWVPGAGSAALTERSLFHRDWLWPIAVMVIGLVVGRLAWFSSGYLFFRAASDHERLPFPTAPAAALSSMALAEEGGTEARTWKWPVFSLGALVGAAFGVLYVGLPAVTALLGARTSILPVPFLDLTPYLGDLLPAAPVAVTLHLGAVLTGMLMPFWLVVGGFVGTIAHLLASPVLYHLGFLPRWQAGMDAVHTQIAIGIDFWRAFSIGVTVAVAAISVHQVLTASRRRRDELREQLTGARTDFPDGCQHPDCGRPARVRGYCLRHLNRGDLGLWLAVALFLPAALYPLVLAKALFPALLTTGLLVTFAGLAFLYAPLISYLTARLEGFAGREAALPHVDDAARALTGFHGVEVWLVPFPSRTFAGQTEAFRTAEMVGLRFTSLLQAELLLVPLLLVASLVYWAFLWRLGPIPSAGYPYAQTVWPLRAFDQAMLLSSTIASRTFGPGDSVDGEELPKGQIAWSPRPLQDGQWWCWRVRATRELEIPDPAKREYGAWSQVGYFATAFRGTSARPALPDPLRQLPARRSREAPAAGGRPPTPVLVWPADGAVVGESSPALRAAVEGEGGDGLAYEFQLDPLPAFAGEPRQRSSEETLFTAVLWRDLRFTGDRRDNDRDGRVDEEVINQRDDDGDGKVDEDAGHPLDGRKWPVSGLGAMVGLAGYFCLAAVGLPLLLLWGYVQSVNGVPALLLPQILGALLARLALWRWYGPQEWRRHAMVLAVGFGTGMALVGTFCAILALMTRIAGSLLS